MTTIQINGNEAFRPTTEDIDAIRIGDLAPTCFGDLQRVTEITARRNDIYGKRFICYYTEFGENGGKISNSLKAGEVLRTLRLCNAVTSNEIRRYDI